MTKLEAALYLAKKGFRIFPLVPNSKIPAIKNFAENATADEEKLSNWFENDEFNLGISTDNLLVLDVDVKTDGQNGLESLAFLSEQGLELPKTTAQVTPTGGYHHIFTVSEPVSNSASKIAPGLDIRGKGGYIVGMGSKIDGVSYKINKAPTVEAPDWLVEACGKAREEISRAREVAAIVDPDKAIARGEKYLKALPPTEKGNRNHEAYKIANVLKDYGVTQADIFYLMSDHWVCIPPLEFTELGAAIASAFKYGKEAQGSASPEALFAEPVSEAELNATSSPDGDAPLHPVAELNKHHAYILLEGKHRILFETKDSDDNFKVQFLEENTFHTMLSSRIITTGDGGAVPLTRLWMRSPERRQYAGLTFRPESKTKSNFYNLWRGWDVKDIAKGETITDEMKKAVDAFQSHIFENVANMDEDLYTWVMAWFAHLLQRPWEKPITAMVLRGGKGVGKNAIFECFKPMFPDHYLVSGDKRYLVSNFNAHFERLLMFVADEMFWSGDKQNEGILKALVTDKKLSIEKKGKDTYSIDSCLRVAILGNEKWVVPASHDERRYAIFDMGEGNKQNRRFFGDLFDNLARGGTRYLFHTLKNTDISKIDVGKIPLTSGLLKQKKMTATTLQKWWLECLETGFIDGAQLTDENGWDAVVDRDTAFESYRTFSKKIGRDRYLESSSEFLDGLRDVCATIKIISRPGERMKLSLPPLIECRNLWDIFMGMKNNWD